MAPLPVFTISIWVFLIVLISLMLTTDDDDTPWRPAEEEAEDQ